ncbi:MAG: hypothetical protein Q8O03_05505 [Nanoarchaeota archaeon]|nr:hypothetical protein [Nanoarchaeota archaeon]
MTDEQKPKTLQDLVIESIKETNLEVPEEEPYVTKDAIFDQVTREYSLTPRNIKQLKHMVCKHKEKEEWLDIYLIEYKEGKIAENYDRMSTKQGILKEKPKKESEGTLRLIIKDNYAVFIRSYDQEIEIEADNVFKNLKNLGLNELRFNLITLKYELV